MGRGTRPGILRAGTSVRLSIVLMVCVGSCFSQSPSRTSSSDEPPWKAAESAPEMEVEEEAPRACNSPGFTLDGSITNDNRRTTGLVLAQGDYFPPVQQGLGAFRLENVLCEKAHLEASAWYSMHDVSTFEENRFQARGIYEGFPEVRLYGGFAYYDNPKGLFTSRSFYLIAEA